MLVYSKSFLINGAGILLSTIFEKNDATPLGLSYLINTSKAIILSSLRDLKARMAGIIIESIVNAFNKTPQGVI